MASSAKRRIAFMTAIPSEHPFRPLHLQLQEACREIGVHLELFKNGNFCYSVKQNSFQLFYEERPINPCDYSLVVVRFSIKAAHGGNNYAIRMFQRQGVPIINPPQDMLRAKDKLQTLENLAAAGLPITPTVVVRTRRQIPQALKLIGPPPYIIKNCFGSKGKEVLLANTAAQLRAIFDSLWHMDRHKILLIQPYLGQEPQSDVRAVYLNYRPWRALLRVAEDGEFRTNLITGALASPLEIEPAEKEICEKATHILKLPLAGIDFLRTPKGPVILEVNACPGLEGIVHTYAEHGTDLISEFASGLAEYVNYPPLKWRACRKTQAPR